MHTISRTAYQARMIVKLFGSLFLRVRSAPPPDTQWKLLAQSSDGLEGKARTMPDIQICLILIVVVVVHFSGKNTNTSSQL